jgi:hypothetical protein
VFDAIPIVDVAATLLRTQYARAAIAAFCRKNGIGTKGGE